MMHPASTGRVGLVRLGDSDFEPRNPEDDLRGKDVYDPEGRRVGGVENLYFDPQEREVRFLEVGAGGLLGIGQKRFLVRVEAVVEVAEGWVAIDPSRKKVDGPAPFDAKVAPPAANHRRAEDHLSPLYGDPNRASDRLDDIGGYGPYGR